MLVGVTTNTPPRTMDSVLPFLGFTPWQVGLDWYICSGDLGHEKPAKQMFARVEEEIREIGGLEAYRGGEEKLEIDPSQILHVGDSYVADYCGARSRGWNALHLDRSGDANVRQYQDWLKGEDVPDWEGRAEEVQFASSGGGFAEKTLGEVRGLLEEAGWGTEG